MSCNGARFELLYEPRPANQALVDRHQGDRYKKKFLYWDHLHTRQVRRTTLADANERRHPRIFEELTRALMAQAGNAIRKERRVCGAGAPAPVRGRDAQGDGGEKRGVSEARRAELPSGPAATEHRG